jgi:hypothetical protein
MENEQTAARIFELLDYCPDTGNFTWKTNRRGKRQAGDTAGCIHPNGYVRISIDYRLYNAHRIAWLFIAGKWPTQNIDHIDGDRANNKALNLRECSQQANCFNKKMSCANTSGYKGVSFLKKSGKWSAHIKHNGKSKYLGCFKAPEEAHKAYCDEAKRLYGEFSHD